MQTLVSKSVCIIGDAVTVHKGCGTVMIDVKQGATIRYHAQVENKDLDELIVALQEYKKQTEAQHTL